MQAVWIALTVLIVGGCIWSLLRRFTSKKTCCGTEKQPRIRVKKLSAPIGSLTVKISGMRCENGGTGCTGWCCRKGQSGKRHGKSLL